MSSTTRLQKKSRASNSPLPISSQSLRDSGCIARRSASTERSSVWVKLASVSSESGHRRAETALTESAPVSSTDASRDHSNYHEGSNRFYS
jgi:hypothetical protein